MRKLHVDWEKVAFSLVGIAVLVYAVSIALSLSNLETVFYTFPDTADTVASVKVAGDYGLTGKVPQFQNGEYVMLGNFPPLFPFLGGILYKLLGDPLIAAELLNLLVSLSIAYVLFFHSFKKLKPEVRLVLILLLFIGEFTGQYFPFGFRMRANLAALFAVLLFTFLPGILGTFVLLFLAFLSQPVFGAIFAGFYALRIIEKKRYKELAGPVLALVAALPFYYNLLPNLGLEPEYYGGLLAEFFPTLAITMAFVLPALLILLKRKATFVTGACILLMLIMLINLTLFHITGKLESTMLYYVPIAKTDLWPSTLLYPALLVFLISYFRSANKIPKYAFLLLSLAVFINVLHVAGFVYEGATVDEHAVDVGDMISSSGARNLITFWAYVNKEGGVYPYHGDFIVSSYMFVKGTDVTFHGTTLPPMLNKGEAYVHMENLFTDVVRKGGRCTGEIEYLKGEGVDSILFIIMGSNKSSISDEEYLVQCSLSLQANGTNWAFYLIE